MVFEKTDMNRKEIEEFLKENMKDAVEQTDEEGNTFRSIYLGSYMGLDQYDRHHHLLYRNGIIFRCEQFWDSIEEVAKKLGGCIVPGERDPADIIFIFDFKDKGNDCENDHKQQNCV